MVLYINRNSVCMGDDVNDHRFTIDMNHSNNYIDVFSKIIRMKYLPSVQGNDVEWRMRVNNKDVLIYKTLNNEVIDVGENIRLQEDDKIMFRYYSSSSNRDRN